MFILAVCILLVTESFSQVYEGDACTDSVNVVAGQCCDVNKCAGALEDLSTGRTHPQVCSYRGNTLIVCCRTGCGETSINRAIQTDGLRKSEMMCNEYDKIETVRSRRRRHYSMDYPNYYGDHHDYEDHHHDYDNHHDFDYHHHDCNQRHDVFNQEQDYAKYYYPTPPTTPLTTTPVVRVYAAVGGVDTSLFEFPHMAALGWPLKTGGFAFNCGGTLISERFVLTAGHCLRNARDSSLANPDPTIVRLGDQNILDSVNDGATPLDVPIRRIYRHPLHRPPIKYYDIALLELDSSVSFSNHIKPACLWTNSTFPTTQATITGWGTTVSGGRQNSAVLQKVDVNILNTEVCRPLLQNAQNRNWQGFQDHQLCAGVLAGGKDACQGDSGGPLQIKAQGFLKKYYVIGITSFGRECAKPNLPGIYTRVSSFLDWIESIVWP